MLKCTVIRPIPPAEKQMLRAMLTGYLQELGQFYDVDLNYPYFEDYWESADRWPYFILHRDQIAGFALVNSWSPSGEGTDFALAELCILPAHRRNGLGQAAMLALLDLHPGVWEISVLQRNHPAKHFWHRAIAQCPKSEFTLIERADRQIYRLERARHLR